MEYQEVNPHKSPVVPIMTQIKYAKEVGQTLDSIRGEVLAKKLATVKLGSTRYVNLLALNEKALGEAFIANFVPIMTQKKFAEEVGQTLDSIRSQVKKGNLPTVTMGRYRYINLLELTDIVKKLAQEQQ